MLDWEYMPGGAFVNSWSGRHVWYAATSEGFTLADGYVLLPPEDVAEGVSRGVWELYGRAEVGWELVDTYEPEPSMPVTPFTWAYEYINHAARGGFLMKVTSLIGAAQ